MYVYILYVLSAADDAATKRNDFALRFFADTKREYLGTYLCLVSYN